MAKNIFFHPYLFLNSQRPIINGPPNEIQGKNGVPMKKHLLLITFLILSGIGIDRAHAATRAKKLQYEIDALAERCLKAFAVPGIAVAVVKDGRVVHARGYGVSSLATNKKVDENTLFAIASNTKPFTTVALGILVDEKKIKWDDKVIDYIPEFRLYSPYVTEEFTIRDLLTHRSGLGLGAGDLMFWPGSTTFTVNEIIHNLRYLHAVSGFRTKYDYDNLLYIVAGEVVARVSGMGWEAFVQTRIMQPLGMSGSAPSFKMIGDRSNTVDAHAPVNGTVQVIQRFDSEVINAAGGIYSNLTDMCKWLTLQIGNGRYGEGLKKQLFSAAVHDEMWTPQTIMAMPCVRPRTPGSYAIHFAGYGLGWTLYDAQGYAVVKHGGGLPGMISEVILIPELKLGILVFTNQQADGAVGAIAKTIMDHYFGLGGTDRVQQYHDQQLADEAQAKKISEETWQAVEAQQKLAAGRPDADRFAGTFSDPWFGEVEISALDGQLWFASRRSPRLRGEMLPYRDRSFVVKWSDRSLDADAFVIFELDDQGRVAGMKMKAVSPLTDFSYDFQDLDFHPVQKQVPR
jgi:CubicO group peptidase (beta-lactamase class C family)